MTIKAVKSFHTLKSRTKLNPAIKGAAIGAGVYAAANCVSWMTHPEEMLQNAKQCGSKTKYAAVLLSGFAIISAFSASIILLCSTMTSFKSSTKR